MILLDKILIGVMLIAAGILLFLVFCLARYSKLWRAWLWDPFEFWNMIGKMQPKENRGLFSILLSKRKKREKDQRRC